MIDSVQERLDTLDRNEDEDLIPSDEQLEFFKGRVGGFNAVMYVPHAKTYDAMLDLLKPSDVICDMGAGDLRFAWRAAKKCKKVYAVEMCPMTLWRGMQVISWKMPRNLIPVCADWRDFPVPADVSVIVCMVNIDHKELPLEEWCNCQRIVYQGVTFVHPYAIYKIIDGKVEEVHLKGGVGRKKKGEES